MTTTLTASTQNAPLQSYLPVARHFGVEDGLPHRQVNCILQDRQGFIWVATNGGVARYDGVRFKIFNKADNGLTTDLVNCLLEDGAGNLWLISSISNGISGTRSIDILNPVTGRVIPLDQYITGKLPVPLTNITFQGIRVDSSRFNNPGTLFFGTSNPGGWVSWHPKTGWKQIIIPSLDTLAVLSVTPQNGILGTYSHDFNFTVLETDACGNVLRYLKADNGGLLALLTGGTEDKSGVFVTEPDETKKRAPAYWEIKAGSGKTRITVPFPDSLQPMQQNLLLKLENGNVWLTESEVFDKNGKRLLDLLAQFPFFNNRNMDDYLVDRSGCIWLGNVFGLELIEIHKDLFRRFLFNEAAVNGGGVACRGIVQKDNRLWVNTEGQRGLQGIDLQTGRVFFQQKETWNYGLTMDSNGYMWSGQHPDPSSETILVHIDPSSGKILDSLRYETNNPIWVIFLERPDQLWLGTQQGLLFFNPKTKEFSKPDTQNFPELKTATIIHIASGKSGAVWLCTNMGFYKMTKTGQIVGRFWSGGKGRNQFPFDDFYHFYEDKQGIFWIGTAGAGLLRWNPVTGEKQLFSRKSGLLNGFVYAVYEDDFGHLWLPTDYGIAQFDKKTLTVRRTWLTADGLAQNEFNRTSHYKGADGTLYFGGLNGVTAFHPKNFYGTSGAGAVNQPAKKLVISDFKWLPGSSGKLENGTAALLASGRNAAGIDGEITMQPSERYFQLEFALLDYFSPKRVSYSYKIEGLDADWNVLNEPQLRLSSLPYGSHHLRIRAQAADGTWAQNELNFTLKIVRPFYLRWWFFVLTGVLLVVTALLLYRWRIKQLVQAKLNLEKNVLARTSELNESLAQEQALLKEKDVLLKEIHHRVKNNLQVISGLLELQEKNVSDDQAKQALHEGRTRVRSMALIHQNLYQYENLSRIELCSFTNDLYEQVSAMFEDKSKYTTANINIPVTEIDLDTAIPFGLALNELLTNSFKYAYTSGKPFTIEMILAAEKTDGEEGNKFIFLYSDTGPGLPEGFVIAKAKTLGMRLVNDLSKQMGGRMSYSFDNGSRFTIVFFDKKARKKKD